MKNKQKIDMIIAIISIIMGVVLLILPLLGITSLKWISITVFSLYAILSIIQFSLTIESKDYEGLHSALSSIIVVIAHFFFDPAKSPRVLAIFILVWVLLMSLTKLKKADYYHDRRDRMWKYSATNLGLFLLTGLLASINLAYGLETQIIVLGFFILINGILELFEPIIKTLIAHS
jgi:uncharacterized membrane protein HdeD (DUF308 family)